MTELLEVSVFFFFFVAEGHSPERGLDSVGDQRMVRQNDVSSVHHLGRDGGYPDCSPIYT